MSDRLRRTPAAAIGAVLGLVVLAVLHVAHGRSYWSFSEGVYALTSRLLLDGHDLYGDVVVAQPPVLFVVGAGFLGISDTIEGLRLLVGLLQLAGGVLAAVTLARLGAGRAWVALAPLLALLMPWAVHEHGALTPETVAVPLLMGAGLLVARRRGAPWAGVLLGLAVFTKFTFLLPAAALVLVAADRPRTLRWTVGAIVVQAGLWTALFGGSLWGDTIVAQSESGTRTVRYLAEVLVQGGWNLLGPLAGCALLAAAWWRGRSRDGAGADERPADGRARDATAAEGATPDRSVLTPDPAQLRASVALAAAMLLTTGTMLKEGTAVNVLVPVEVALLPVGLLGLAVAWRTTARPAWRAGLVALAFLPLAQSGALLAAPTDPVGFLRPFSADAWARVLSHDEVDAEVARARGCPAGAPYGGWPYLAFVADRPMPDNQPDLFITWRVPYHHATLARMQADGPPCPPVNR